MGKKYIITGIDPVDLHNCSEYFQQGMEGYRLVSVMPYNDGARFFWERIDGYEFECNCNGFDGNINCLKHKERE